MKILSLILSTTMLINSIPCHPARAKAPLDEERESIQAQTTMSASADYARTEDFRRVIQRGTFVDKTPFIKEVVESSDEAILITRPRRWGKSLNFSMLRYFLNREVGRQGRRVLPNPNRALFTGGQYTFIEEVEEDGETATKKRTIDLSPLKISEDPEFITTHQGQYPTIFISLKDVEASTYQAVEDQLRLKISQAFSEHPYLLNNLYKQSKDHSDYAKQQDALLFLDKFNSIRKQSSTLEDLKDSLRFLSGLLRAHHGRNAYILIDEYDTPLHQVASQDALNNVTLLLRGLFSSACKGNLSVEKCLFTGILRIAQANLLSGLNNPGVYTLLDSKYAPYYGFTQEEVNKLFEGKQLDEFQYPADRSIVPEASTTRVLSVTHNHNLRKKQEDNLKGSSKQSNELTQELARIYNGYLIGGIHLYNPWSIVNVLSDKVLRPYWVDSGGISYIKDALFSSKANEIWSSVKDQKPFLTEITKDISMSTLRNPDSLPSLLFHAGYLTLLADEEQTNKIGKARYVIIPNEEVHREFERLLDKYLSADSNKLDKAKRVFRSILNQNATEFDMALVEFGSKIKFTSGWNFNFLQVAALTGNKEIFGRLLEYDETLLSNKLGTEQLGIADYILLGGHAYPQLTGYDALVQKPSIGKWAVCSSWAGFTYIGLGVTAISWDILRKLWKTITHSAAAAGGGEHAVADNSDTRFQKLIFWSLSALGAAELVKYYSESDFLVQCKDYREYNKVDISKPASLSSFKQYEKYILENPDAYISLNGTCKEHTRQVPVNSLKIPAVNVESIPVTTISLTLCDKPKNQDT